MPVYRKFDRGFELLEFGDRLLVARIWRRDDEPFYTLGAVAGKRGENQQVSQVSFARLESRSTAHQLCQATHQVTAA